MLDEVFANKNEGSRKRLELSEVSCGKYPTSVALSLFK